MWVCMGLVYSLHHKNFDEVVLHLWVFLNYCRETESVWQVCQSKYQFLLINGPINRLVKELKNRPLHMANNSELFY